MLGVDAAKMEREREREREREKESQAKVICMIIYINEVIELPEQNRSTADFSLPELQ